MTVVPLWRIAHGRAGDKGDILNISVIGYRAEDFAAIRREVTPERVAALFAPRKPRSVKVHVLERLGALNIVIDGALEGGVNRSLSLDRHGKTLSMRLLDLSISLADGPERTAAAAMKQGGN